MQPTPFAELVGRQDRADEHPRLTALAHAARDPRMDSEEFSPPLDPGIAHAVKILRSVGIETFESCEGGQGHAYPEPTVRFHGCRAEGMRALAAVQTFDLPVSELRRVWPINDGEPTGPWWELTFSRKITSHPC